MRLPRPLSRHKKNVYKNNFGHVFVLAGSGSMLGAGCLVSSAAIRSGAGLVTWGVPASLNAIAQKKAPNVVMTLPLEETKKGCVSFGAKPQIARILKRCDAVALGPGLTTGNSVQKLVFDLVKNVDLPMVIDADGLNCLAEKLEIFKSNPNTRIVTPHPKEMSRLTGLTVQTIEKNRKKTAVDFAKTYRCIVVLKGYKSIVASPSGKVYVNSTGNSGLATAGSGDVLTGMIAAFLAQGVDGFEAACFAVYLHGLAADLAVKTKTRIGLIATDVIDFIPNAFKKVGAL